MLTYLDLVPPALGNERSPFVLLRQYRSSGGLTEMFYSSFNSFFWYVLTGLEAGRRDTCTMNPFLYMFAIRYHVVIPALPVFPTAPYLSCL